MNFGADLPVGHLHHSDQIELARTDQERRMGRVKRLIGLCQARDCAAEIALLEAMKAQPGLIQQQNGVLVLVGRLREEDNEERHQPLEAL